MAEITVSDTCSLEEQEEMKTIFKSKGMNACLEHFKRKTSEWETIPLNIGVIGECGVGKSSYINAMRDLRKGQKGWAPVGVNETTKEPTKYPHETHKMLELWDLPGVGTKHFPKESYFKKIEMHKYDCFVLITAVRFTELDGWLAEEIHKRNKHFYFVRSKIEIDVKNERSDSERDREDTKEPIVKKTIAQKKIEEEAIVENIRKSTLEHLKELKFKDSSVFLIDSKKSLKYDFGELVKTIINNLPVHKRQAMILSMTVLTESVITMKVEELHKLAWFAAFSSAVVGAIPIPGVSLAFDSALLLGTLWSYFRQLGLDEDSLKQRAQAMGVDYESVEAIVRDKFPAHFGIEMLKILAQTGGFVVGTLVEEGMKCIPIIGTIVGCVVGSTISFAYTKYVLYSQLEKMKETSLELAKLYWNSNWFA